MCTVLPGVVVGGSGQGGGGGCTVDCSPVGLQALVVLGEEEKAMAGKGGARRGRRNRKHGRRRRSGGWGSWGSKRGC